MQLIIIALLAWLVAQVAKFSIRAYGGYTDLRLFYQSGGMPSAHSSTVCALVVASLAIYGYQSPIFGLSGVFAAIVIYDSLGVRRASGEQSLVINAIINKLGSIKPIREVLGHTPAEVIAGGTLGIITALLLTLSHWEGQVSFLLAEPIGQERLLYLAIFLLLGVFGLTARLILIKLKKVRIISKLKLAVTTSLIIPALLGLFLSLMQYESIYIGAWRLWSWFLLVAIMISQVFLYFRLYKTARGIYEKQKNNLINMRLERRKIKKNKRKR